MLTLITKESLTQNHPVNIDKDEIASLVNGFRNFEKFESCEDQYIDNEFKKLRFLNVFFGPDKEYLDIKNHSITSTINKKYVAIDLKNIPSNTDIDKFFNAEETHIFMSGTFSKELYYLPRFIFFVKIQDSNSWSYSIQVLGFKVMSYRNYPEVSGSPYVNSLTAQCFYNICWLGLDKIVEDKPMNSIFERKSLLSYMSNDSTKHFAKYKSLMPVLKSPINILREINKIYFESYTAKEINDSINLGYDEMYSCLVR